MLTPAIVDLNIYMGANFDFDFQVFEADGVTIKNLQTEGYTNPVAKMKKFPTTDISDVIDFTSALVANVVTISLSLADTSTIPVQLDVKSAFRPTIYIYSLDITDPGGKVQRLAYGIASVIVGV